MIVLTISICACDSEHDYDVAINELESGQFENTEEIHEDGSEFDVFSDLTGFTTFLLNVQQGEGYADLSSLEKYYFPVGIPDDYELYKITAGVVNIGFWFLPKEKLISEDVALLAEARQEHFLFISPREHSSMDIMQSQFGFEESELIDGKYYVVEYAPNVILWIQDDAMFELYVPANNIQRYTDESVISDICETETVIIER